MADNFTEPPHLDLVSEQTLDPILLLRQQQRPQPEKKDDEETDEEAKERKRKDKLVQKAHAHFKLSENADKEQRKRELEDLQFDRALPEDQWPESIINARKGGVGPGGYSPERPCLTIPLLDQPVQQTLAEARGARLAVIVKPKGEKATKEDARIRQGLIRAIEVDSRAHIARQWALDRASKCGRGWYRIVKRYVIEGREDIDETDPAFYDQELAVVRILNQHSVYADPFAQEPDASDMNWCILTSDLTADDHDRLFPDAKLTKMSDETLTGIGDKVPGWISGDAETGRSFRVGEYIYVDKKRRTRVYLEGEDQDGNPMPVGSKWKDELPKGLYDYAKAYKHILQEREVETRHVKWCFVNATEVLKEGEWEGPYIPVIGVIGKESNINGQRCWKGIVSNAKDAQRAYNYARSQQVEGVGIAPKAPWVMAEGQDEGREQMWDTANVINYPRLIYKPTTFEGHLVGPPQRQTAEPPIQAMGLMAQEAASDVRVTTGRPNVALERPRMRVRSGKATRALQAEGEQTTSVYLENLATISMTHEGRILNAMLEHVYDRPGRIARIIGDDDSEETVMLGAPFVMANGQPQPAPNPNLMGRLATAAGRMMGKSQTGKSQTTEPRHYDLKKGTFNVVVSIGKKKETKNEENNQLMSSIAQAAPQLVPIFADLWVRSMDSPVSKQIADRLQKTNPAARGEEKDQGQPIPPQAQQRIQMLEQQVQQLGAIAKQATEAVRTESVGAQRDLTIKAMELATKERIEYEKIRKDLLLGELEKNTERALKTIEATIDAVTLHMTQLQERNLLAMTHAHETGMRALDAMTPQPEPQPTIPA